MSVELVPMLYPWDVVGAPRLPDELRALGARRVIVAAHYHAAYASTPRHPEHQIIDARHSAMYTGDAISVDDLHLPRPTWCEPDVFAQAMETLRTAGFLVDGWIAPGHVDAAKPEEADRHRVQNAFGNVVAHALCVSDPVGHEFIEAVARSAVATGPDGLVVDSIAQWGSAHAYLHDKSSGADWSPEQQRLLSICFCTHCADSYSRFGEDPDQMKSAIRDAFSRSARSTATALLERYEAAVLGTRSLAIAYRRRRMVELARQSSLDRVSLHSTSDPWATGPLTPIGLPALPSPSSGDGSAVEDAEPDALVAICWGSTDRSIAEIGAIQRIAGDHAEPAEVNACVSILPSATGDDLALTADGLADDWRALHDAGAREIHVYHLGLVSEQRLTVATAAGALL